MNAKQTATKVAAPVAPKADAPAKAKAIRYVKGPFPGNGVIRLKGTANPKRPTGKSFHRFALHKDGQTVDQYVKACTTSTDPRVNCKAALALSDIRWDVAHGFIQVDVPADTK
jgi:hypothetical protein